MHNLVIPPFSEEAAQASQKRLDALAKVPRKQRDRKSVV